MKERFARVYAQYFGARVGLYVLIIVLIILTVSATLILDIKSEQVQLERYDGEFVLKPTYERVHDTENIALRISTTKEYGCFNYKIKTTVDRKPRVVQVTVGDVQKWRTCLTALGPASTLVYIEIDPIVTVLEIRSNNRVDIYKLLREGRNVFFKPIDTNFTRLDNSRIYIRPPNYTVVQCVLRHYCGKEDNIDELCPLVFTKMAEVSEEVDPSIVSPEIAATNWVRNRAERHYLYSGTVEELRSLYHEFEQYKLPHGRTVDCRGDGAGNSRYYLKIESELLPQGETLFVVERTSVVR